LLNTVDNRLLSTFGYSGYKKSAIMILPSRNLSKLVEIERTAFYPTTAAGLLQVAQRST
jgi:hypothetical protein